MRNSEFVKRTDACRADAASPPRSIGKRQPRKRKLSADEAEYRWFAVAAGAAVAALIGLVGALVSQLP